jgi:hypothetical protein
MGMTCWLIADALTPILAAQHNDFARRVLHNAATALFFGQA